MKEKLVILSDLWGLKKAGYLSKLVDILETHYEIQVLDSIQLAGIDQRVYTKESLHRQFVQGGIDRASNRLKELLNEPTSIVAFSVGGVIAWKAALNVRTVNHLVCISSTRLRLEDGRPNCTVDLIFGENDEHRPDHNWFSRLGIDPIEISNAGHDFYRTTSDISFLIPDLIKQIH